MIVRSKAPLRIGFGGGTDVPPTLKSKVGQFSMCGAPQKLYRVDPLVSSSLAAGAQVFKVR